jgi:NADPH:quinone reductase-like Zn-dependent oxidoreductase
MSEQIIPAGHHLAALLEEAGAPLQIKPVPTSTPEPREILIKASAVALNLVDHAQRDKGFAVERFPYVLGSDAAGTILAVGDEVSQTDFPVGARVLVFATAYYGTDNKHGSFQQCIIVSSERVTVIPDKMSFADAALIPMVRWI